MHFYYLLSTIPDPEDIGKPPAPKEFIVLGDGGP